MSWISRYGSLTFNHFGRDFPDGGMNEAGLFIWEMNEEAEYPKNDSLPKLNQMNWMQFILDNYSTTEEAIRSASEFEIDGWSWHYFVGDARGNTAAIAFIDGEVVVHTGEEMPVPALFNAPYDRELQLLKYFKGFGGEYMPEVENPNVPRLVRTAVLIDQYEEKVNPVEYGFYMLKTLRVYEDPEWSMIFDVQNRMIHFRTRKNPEVKAIKMDEVNFNSNEPAQIINIATSLNGNVLPYFQPYSKETMRRFIKNELLKVLPKEFYTHGGLSADEFTDRLADHSDSYTDSTNHFFRGIWNSLPGTDQNELNLSLKFEIDGNAVTVAIAMGEQEQYSMVNNLQMIGKQFCFTFHTVSGQLMEVKGLFNDDEMHAKLFGIEEFYGDYSLQKGN
ncbi:MAG TPA: hypothetical protein VEP89_11535 [Draconibacterium sp.]|nr:hypothetical protein [Draconibacterium sp.]